MRPIWKEGLFILPQHFQLMEQHQEALLQKRVESICAHGWGVVELQINQDALARGTFSLSRLRAVMPDGLWVEVGPEESLKGLEISADLLAGKNHVDVFLAVPSEVTRGSSTFASGDAGSRFVAVSRPTQDAYGIAEATDIECVHPNAQLLLGRSDLRNCVTIKLAELEAREGGCLALRSSYVPPCLQIGAVPSLRHRLAELVKVLIGEQGVLASRFRGRNKKLGDMSASDTISLFSYQSINTWIPTLLHCSQGAAVHPEQLYLYLGQLAGSLCTFDVLTTPRDWPRYDHRNLGGTFAAVFGHLKELVEAIGVRPYTPIELQMRQRGLSVGQVLDKERLEESQLYLLATGTCSEKTLKEQVPQHIKIAAVEQIADIVRAAVSGVTVEVEATPPTSIPTEKHQVCMRLVQTGSFWEGVLRSKTVAVYQPVEPDHIKLQLLAVER